MVIAIVTKNAKGTALIALVLSCEFAVVIEVLGNLYLPKRAWYSGTHRNLRLEHRAKALSMNVK